MFLLYTHSGFRYLALLAGLAVIGYALYGAAKERPHDKTMKNLALTFRTMMDVTAILGVVLVTTGYGFYNDLGMHVIVMLLATAVSHVVPAVMRRRKQSERTVLPYAVATVISLGLLAVGMLSIHRPVVG